ncbi:BON domain-containing protein [Dyella acidiphila]|uniref:BON domain-containing protein n=1 Tax=Dyella acidiphila TaxID=2775866 RepID=A0ABR9GCQ2_9GAMM|nr:BON domain-containing protein [Dyella acidiphila]MBE1161822.1 BON domain-containing protein [Dyella acidiphila]
MHGPYGHSQQYDLGPESWIADEDFARPRHRSDAHRRQERQQGAHRGIGPQNYTRSDERVRDDVCDRLTDHPEVDARHLDVTVENGVVLLQGTVSDRVMKYGAEDCSWHVNGVKDVDNRIRVDRRQPQQREGSSQL